jgi:ketosteroid isomerase-like protein
MTTATDQTMRVGRRLVELIEAGKNREAIEELYADDAVSVEAAEGGPGGRVTEGKQKVLEMSDWFFSTMDVHGGTIDGPYPHDDRFICFMSVDLTPKEGPMAGQRMQMKEAALYSVRDGAIVRSEFFYDASC